MICERDITNTIYVGKSNNEGVKGNYSLGRFSIIGGARNNWPEKGDKRNAFISDTKTKQPFWSL